MRINSISLRLGYTTSWLSPVTPGRNYTKNFIDSHLLINSYLKGIFGGSVLKKNILLSRSSLKSIDGGRRNLLLLYVYMHRAVELSKLRSSSVRKILYKNFVKVFLRRLSTILKQDLSRILPSPATIEVKYVLIEKRFFDSVLVSDYIISKLSNKFKLSRIIPTLAKDLIKDKGKSGLLVYCSGRFDRKERASSHIFSYGKLSLSSLNNNRIDYAQKETVLKYGICGIKVWVCK